MAGCPIEMALDTTVILDDNDRMVGRILTIHTKVE